MAKARTYVTHSADETRRFGIHLGRCLTAGTVTALSGDLGAGKTTLTQGLAAGLGLNARVTSPTFTLVNEYEIDRADEPGTARLIHVDCYRLGDTQDEASAEAETLGMEEFLDDPDAVVVVEWAERLRSMLPSDHLQITLETAGNDVAARAIIVTATGPRSQAILARLQHS